MARPRLSARSLRVLADMDIPVWELRDAGHDVGGTIADQSVSFQRDLPASFAAQEPVGSHLAPAADTDIARADWETLHAAINSCQRCELGCSRTHAVCGTGNRQADWLIVGEAPGAEEDASGEPFVGRAGRLLTEMLRAMGHERDHVFIANVLKCRPPGNADPSPAQVAQCMPFLRRQIELLQPKLILALGLSAAQSLLGTDLAIARLRGRVHSLELSGRTIPVVVTYHPAYLLRRPQEKAQSWSDLLFAIDVAAGSAA